MNENEETIINEAKPQFFTIVFNLIDELPLSPLATALYFHYVRWGNAKRRKAKGIRFYKAKYKVSGESILKAKEELVNHGLITITKFPSAESRGDEIHLIDIEVRNAQYFIEKKNARPVPNQEHPVPNEEHPPVPNQEHIERKDLERKNLETSKKNAPAKFDSKNLVNPEMESELDEIILWLQQKKNLKRLPVSEWIDLLADLAIEEMDNAEFKLFYTWVDKLPWTNAISPKLLRGQVEAWRNRETIAAKKAMHRQTETWNGNGVKTGSEKLPSLAEVEKERAEFAKNNPRRELPKNEK